MLSKTGKPRCWRFYPRNLEKPYTDVDVTKDQKGCLYLAGVDTPARWCRFKKFPDGTLPEGTRAFKASLHYQGGEDSKQDAEVDVWDDDFFIGRYNDHVSIKDAFGVLRNALHFTHGTERALEFYRTAMDQHDAIFADASNERDAMLCTMLYKLKGALQQRLHYDPDGPDPARESQSRGRSGSSSSSRSPQKRVRRRLAHSSSSSSSSRSSRRLILDNETCNQMQQPEFG